MKKALFGATINYNPDSQSNTGAFNRGHNLHTLTVTERQITVRIPVIIPTCN
ncbi:MAG: hypothetical protein IPG76_23030 [Acidobacteria bacterium]|nr:hypothetical protein [Acidobacteriota bacterium]